MSFWKKLFGVTESPKTDIAERESTPLLATSDQQLVLPLCDAPNPGGPAFTVGALPAGPAGDPPSNQPIPATPQQPTHPQAQPVATPDQTASFHSAVKGGDLRKLKALI